MFTNIINSILLAISLISAPQPSQVEIEVVEAPNIREQVLTLNNEDLNQSIELFEEMKSSCSKNGCSLAAHQ